MAAELIKLADVKFLREVSKIAIVPMLITAYLNQSGFSFFGTTVNYEAVILFQILQFLYIFIGSSLFVGFIAWIIHDCLLYFQFFTKFIGLTVLSALFLAFGFLGLYGHEIPLVDKLNNMWFYTSFICGFYCLARAEDILSWIDES